MKAAAGSNMHPPNVTNKADPKPRHPASSRPTISRGTAALHKIYKYLYVIWTTTFDAHSTLVLRQLLVMKLKFICHKYPGCSMDCT